MRAGANAHPIWGNTDGSDNYQERLGQPPGAAGTAIRSGWDSHQERPGQLSGRSGWDSYQAGVAGTAIRSGWHSYQERTATLTKPDDDTPCPLRPGRTGARGGILRKGSEVQGGAAREQGQEVS